MTCLEEPTVAVLDALRLGHGDRPTLRFVTCGSVDDGKSTLVGRLLYDSKMLLDDQLAALASESKTAGTTGGDLDFALLVDGLQAEREQGITIDVAYRFFATSLRRFVVADTPGHVQYTRNMATGASSADLAVVLIDARKGVITQTRRHSAILGLLGVRHVVLAVNKMDLAGYDAERFTAIAVEYRMIAAQLGIHQVQCIPVVGARRRQYFHRQRADALVRRADHHGISRDGGRRRRHREPAVAVSGAMGEPAGRGISRLLRAHRQRDGAARRRVNGAAFGALHPCRRHHRGPRARRIAPAGQSVTLTLADEVDVSRGDVLTSGGRAAGFGSVRRASRLVRR